MLILVNKIMNTTAYGQLFTASFSSSNTEPHFHDQKLKFNIGLYGSESINFR